MIGEPTSLSFLFSGGMRLDLPFTSQHLYELAKMDGAIIVNPAISKLVYANVQLMPDPTIPSAETGTRHRTAERVAKQTGALVISISQQRETVTLFVGDLRYQLGEISDVLARTNQALGRSRPTGSGSTRASRGSRRSSSRARSMLDDVLVVLQRAEMTTRMADEIERNCVELGEEGRLIRMQLDELIGGRAAARRPRSCSTTSSRASRRSGPRRSTSCSRTSRTRSCSSSRSSPSCSATRATRTRSTTRSRRAATACCRTSRGCPRPSSAHVVRDFATLEAVVRASHRELEAVDGVGSVRAREIREGLRRLQEHNLVDRYLQL